MAFFKKKEKSQEDYYLASQWVLMGRKLKRHKLARISLVILGILYLYAKVLTLSVVLPVYAVCFCVIPVLQFLDIKSSGRTGFVNYLSPIFWGIISIAVIVATVVYYVG